MNVNKGAFARSPKNAYPTLVVMILFDNQRDSMQLGVNHFLKNYVLPSSKSLVFLLGLSWVYAVCEQCSFWLPFLPVPISIQPAPLFLATLLFGWPAVQAFVLYLAQGACGLPFFAGMHSGLFRLCGPTGGYLIGFLCSIVVLALLREPLLGNRYKLLCGLTLATIITFACGLAQLSFFVPIDKLFAAGLFPFLIGDFFLKPTVIMLITGCFQSVKNSFINRH